MKIILASNNKNKIIEIKKMLPEIEVLSLNEVGYDKDIEENGTTFFENALIKAKTIYDIYHIPVIADDSGLEVEALGGRPGVYSHRYASDLCDDNLNNQKLVKELQGITNRKANYTCCLCYYDGTEKFFEGKCYGVIVDIAKGENGFGYDPYFYIPELGKTMAELSLTEKNGISHRAVALLKLKEAFNEIFNSVR